MANKWSTRQNCTHLNNIKQKSQKNWSAVQISKTFKLKIDLISCHLPFSNYSCLGVLHGELQFITYNPFDTMKDCLETLDFHGIHVKLVGYTRYRYPIYSGGIQLGKPGLRLFLRSYMAQLAKSCLLISPHVLEMVLHWHSFPRALGPRKGERLLFLGRQHLESFCSLWKKSWGGSMPFALSLSILLLFIDLSWISFIIHHW